MAKEGVFELDGEIIEVLPAGKFRVKLKEMDLVITGYSAGKMKQAHISVIMGDWVKVEVNQYDMSQGRIVYRYNPTKRNQQTEEKMAA
ncbi:MAG: translation initiation factor IF-1 [Candidatus Peribacteria bacterium]|jgi:translation initiation factor IF-1|nr:translation initiation factor IF-1 [Candidatus Peribacteria bacterium]